MLDQSGRSGCLSTPFLSLRYKLAKDGCKPDLFFPIQVTTQPSRLTSTSSAGTSWMITTRRARRSRRQGPRVLSLVMFSSIWTSTYSFCVTSLCFLYGQLCIHHSVLHLCFLRYGQVRICHSVLHLCFLLYGQLCIHHSIFVFFYMDKYAFVILCYILVFSSIWKSIYLTFCVTYVFFYMDMYVIIILCYIFVFIYMDKNVFIILCCIFVFLYMYKYIFIISVLHPCFRLCRQVRNHHFVLYPNVFCMGKYIFNILC